MSRALYIIILVVVPITWESSEFRIMGGKDADEEKYAYIVRLQHIKTFLGHIQFSMYIHVCTGAVLTPTWTLTAAHCLFLKGSEIIDDITTTPVIRFGPVKDVWSPDLVREIILAIEHPGYRLHRLIFELNNDIGLVNTKPIILNEYARISSLDFVTLYGQEVTLTGYGLINTTSGFIDDATEIGKPLQRVDVLAMPCDKEEVKMFPAICTVRICSQSSGLCPGDSGGPMLHPSGVAGVNSVGPKNVYEFCSLNLKTPNYDVGVITPTSPYIDWISDNIRSDSLISSSQDNN